MSTLRIEHRTRFTYASEIVSSYNEARLTPAWLPRQRVLDSRVEIDPSTWRTTYRDYWETDVVAFEVLQPHSALTVVGSSIVEVSPVRQRDERVGWTELQGPRFQDLLCEYLGNTPTTEPSEELKQIAEDAAGRLSPELTARAICDVLHDRIGYVPGSTSVHTPATHAWEASSGVCQDFAHLAIGALRHVDIPARYVSGYLHPKRDAEIGESVAGESHAWVEWWTGDWHGFDPTNDREVGDHHVIVGRGREYRDVPPLMGVVAGETSSLDVRVTVTQTA
ncbi:transglutaminase family protein [Demequina capsici]|uniref:Transglutaminase family protein n=1 Tax=Demequina capsici TaxID=3075620 RepID=A0AA96FDK2_9MICO|nr:MULTISPECIES: transglutaminase family protein [unclassified Demequina]WNM25463.1 transglutaminase family protein [Demequina sp. OYTSA14]WNM28344.1 transglutaminase family protein [Demequina sp. PMTSA13]